MKMKILTEFLDHEKKVMDGEGLEPSLPFESGWKSVKDYQTAAIKRFHKPPHSVVNATRDGAEVIQPFAHRGLGIVYMKQTIILINDGDKP